MPQLSVWHFALAFRATQCELTVLQSTAECQTGDVIRRQDCLLELLSLEVRAYRSEVMKVRSCWQSKGTTLTQERAFSLKYG